MPRRGHTRQFTFAGGEISGDLYGRSDLQRYRSSMRKCLNWMVRPTGSVRNRPGTKFVAVAKAAVFRLIPFIAADGQSYAIEISDKIIRFHTTGGAVFWPDGTHNEQPGNVLIDTTQSWETNQFVGSVVKNVTDTTQDTVASNTSNKIFFDTPGQTVWAVDDIYSIEAPLELAAPWGTSGKVVDDLNELNFAQLGDILIIVHKDYSPRELRRVGNDQWLLQELTLTQDVQAPTLVDVPAPILVPAANVEDWSWVVTTVDGNGRESVASAEKNLPAVNISPGNVPHNLVTWTAPTSGPTPVLYNVYRSRGSEKTYGFVGSSTVTQFTDPGALPDLTDSPPVNRNPFEREAPTETHPTFLLPASSNIGGSPGVAFVDVIKNIANILPSGDNPALEGYLSEYKVFWHAHLVSTPSATIAFKIRSRPAGGGAWTDEKTIHLFNIDTGVTLDQNGITVFTRTGLGANAEFRIEFIGSTIASPFAFVVFDRVEWRTVDAGGQIVQNFARSVCLFEQRAIFGGLATLPDLLVMSRIGDIHNYDQRRPLADDDSFELSVASRTIDVIRHVVPLDAIIIMTTNNAWLLRGPEGGFLGPTTFDLDPVAAHGVNLMPPIVIGNQLLHVDARARRVRELKHDTSFGFSRTESRDLSVLAQHLTKRYSLTEWAYQEVPDNIIWCVRSDGTIVAITYQKEHDVWGWHRHETRSGDTFLTICAIPELATADQNGEYIPGKPAMDAVYIGTSRSVNGSTVHHIERMSNRDHIEIKQGVYLDDAVSFDGRNTDSAVLIQAQGGTTWAAAESMTLEATAGTPFTAADVGAEFELQRVVGGVTFTNRWRVTAFVDTNTLTAFAVTVVPVELRTQPTAHWGRAHNSFTLSPNHLEAETVGLLVDGGTHVDKVVTSGVVTLDADRYGMVVHIGLRYAMELETIPIDTGQTEGGLAAHLKNVEEVHLMLDEFVGLEVGQRLNNLRPISARSVAHSWGTGTVPDNKLVIIKPDNKWEKVVDVAVSQTEPLPSTVHSIIVGFGAADED